MGNTLMSQEYPEQFIRILANEADEEARQNLKRRELFRRTKRAEIAGERAKLSLGGG
jgi:hypothetical protein